MRERSRAARGNELFYWVTILVSNTLGTALGDFTASDTGLGFVRGAVLFAGLIALVAAAHYFTKISGAVLFWAAYILTRPLLALRWVTRLRSPMPTGAWHWDASRRRWSSQRR